MADAADPAQEQLERETLRRVAPRTPRICTKCEGPNDRAEEGYGVCSTCMEEMSDGRD